MKTLAAGILVMTLAQLAIPSAAANPDLSPRYSTPGDRQFIADARGVGIPGNPATSYVYTEPGVATTVDFVKYADLSQADSNILGGGITMCYALQGVNSDMSKMLNTFFGLTPSSSQLSTLFASAKANIC